MDSKQLKLLAVRLRDLLTGWKINVSHGQALDLVAALPGLRNWPEVMAFPDGVAARVFDFDAMGRLARRVSTVFAQTLQPQSNRLLTPENLMDLLAPWTIYASRDPSQRARLIIASGDSAAGCLRLAQIADRVECASYRLVWGPVPAGANDPSTFIEERLTAYDTDPRTSDQPDDWQRERPQLERLQDWSDHLPLLSAYERIELWIDPDPNSQLQLLQLLDWFGRHPNLLEKLFVMHAAKPLSECRPYEVRMMSPRIEKVTEREIELASRAWDAYRQPTPRAWFGLLSCDLSVLPQLQRTVLVILNELPAAESALRATERRILDVIAQGETTPEDVLRQLTRHDPLRVFGYWELGQLLDGLGRGAQPAVSGLAQGPFKLAMHDDQASHKRYMRSKLMLSEFGWTLRKGQADFAQHANIHFWWGGTKLTNQYLWRWDASRKVLLEPRTPGR